MMGMERISEDEILIGQLFNGVLKYHIPTGSFSSVKGLPGGDSIHFNSVREVLKDHKGRVWLASSYHRLARYLPEKNRIITLSQHPFGAYNFEGVTAYCVYEDRQHNIWVGTTARGVYLFNPDHNRVRHYPQNDYVPTAIPRSQVTCLAFLDSHTLLAGTERGASLYDTRSGIAVTHKGSSGFRTAGPPDQVQSGLQDRRGIIWMGSARLGLARFDPKRKQWTRFTKADKRSKPLPEDTFTDMLELPDGNLLLLNLNRPVIFNTRTFDCYAYKTDPAFPLFGLSNISDLCYDSSHAVWLSSYRGQLYRYDPVQKTLEDHSSRLTAVAARLVLHKIASDSEGNIWCATNKGIVKTSADRPARLYTINTPDNALREVRGVLPIGGNVWFCNNRSVGRLQGADGKITMLGEKDGLKAVQLFSNTLIRSPLGSILVGGHTGFFEIYPDSMQAQLPSPAPHLTSFNVYDKPYPGSQTVSALRSIALKHTENFFSFDISAFDYIGAEDIEYAYMLEGFDKEWQYTQRQRTGAYTNVPGGHYRLLLKARNSYSDWSANGQVIDIFIAKPYWKQWWFSVLLALVTGAILYLIYHFRVKAVRKEARLRTIYETKVNELENSVLRTQMNPHFIFNSLNTINSYILLNNTAEANQYISRFSRLMRLILEHSRAKQILLSDELEALERYIELERIRFENKFDYQIIVQEDINPAIVEIPPLIIQPFVENAILHGLLPLPDTGMLTITIKRTSDVLWCIVADNGIGRERSRARKHRNMGKQKSHGMEITTKRIELFNRSHQIVEQVRIIDVSDDGMTGTIVEIPVVWQESF
jgi:ligand-binding sensor domain-containing protein